MNRSRKPTATKALLLALLLAGFDAGAGEVGMVAELSGPLLVKKADGTMKILARQSIVEPGDVLFSQKAGYARIRFKDGSEFTLQPESQLEIAAFAFDDAHPESDLGTFRLLGGGVQVVSGRLGARSPARFMLTTPAGVVAIPADPASVNAPHVPQAE